MSQALFVNWYVCDVGVMWQSVEAWRCMSSPLAHCTWGSNWGGLCVGENKLELEEEKEINSTID